MSEAVTLRMDDQEAHDVHHAIAVTVQLLQQVGAQPGAPLTAESEGRLLLVARRLSHERRHKGTVPNPHAAASAARQLEEALETLTRWAEEARGHYGIEECSRPGGPATEWDDIQDGLAKAAWIARAALASYREAVGR